MLEPLISSDGLIVTRWGGQIHARQDYAPLCGAKPSEQLADDRIQVLDAQFPMLEFEDQHTLAWLKDTLREAGFFGLNWCPACRHLLKSEATAASDLN